MSNNDDSPPKSSGNSTPRNKPNFEYEDGQDFSFDISTNKNPLIPTTTNNNDNKEKNNNIIIELEQKSTAQDTYIQKEIEPIITNIVGKLTTGAKLDLREIPLLCLNTTYDENKHNFAIMRTKNPKATFTIFKTGEITITGAKNEKDLIEDGKYICKLIKSNGFEDVKFKHLKIENYSATYNFGFKIFLQKLQICLSKEFKHSPCYFHNKFPGLTFQMKEPKANLNFFHSGKVNIVGVKKRNHIKEALEKIYHIVLENEFKVESIGLIRKKLINFDNIKKD